LKKGRPPFHLIHHSNLFTLTHTHTYTHPNPPSPPTPHSAAGRRIVTRASHPLYRRAPPPRRGGRRRRSGGREQHAQAGLGEGGTAMHGRDDIGRIQVGLIYLFQLFIYLFIYFIIYIFIYLFIYLFIYFLFTASFGCSLISFCFILF